MDWVAIDIHIAGNVITHRLAERFRLRVAEASGLLVLTFAGMAEHAPDGQLGDVPSSQIEAWAHWHGKRGAYAAFFREQLCDEAGLVRDWEEWNGANMRAAESSKDRSRRWRELKRKERETRELAQLADAEKRVTNAAPNGVQDGKRTPVDPSVGTPVAAAVGTAQRTPFANGESASRTAFATGSERVANASTGQDKTRQNHKSDAVAVDLDLEHLPVEPSGSAATASPAAQESEEPLEQTTKLPRNAARLLLHCYDLRANALPTPRQTQVRRDLELTLTDRGAVLSSGVKVKAVDAEHLDAACGHVVGKPLDRKDAAIRHVLLWLQDTYLETVVAREKAARGEDAPRAAAPANPVAVGRMMRDQADFEIASTWLACQSQSVRDTIDGDLKRSGAHDSSPRSKAMIERGLVIAAWRSATANTANVNATPQELAHAS